MRNVYFQIILFSVILALLSGCVTKPKQIIFHPDLQLVQSQITGYHPASAISVKINDRRGISHLATVTQDNGDKQFIEAAAPPIKTISDQFLTLLSSLTINTSNDAVKHLTLHVDMIDVRIKQSHVAHDVSVQVQFTLVINTPTNTFKKPFYGNMRIEGIFKYDLAVIERELNQLVETIFQKMLSDQEVKTYILEP